MKKCTLLAVVLLVISLMVASVASAKSINVGKYYRDSATFTLKDTRKPGYVNLRIQGYDMGKNTFYIRMLDPNRRNKLIWEGRYTGGGVSTGMRLNLGNDHKKYTIQVRTSGSNAVAYFDVYNDSNLTY
ncbi:MAG: hypothetical protein IJ849_07045 [Selenomonadaceae bacterium]|nr:hypothetical protein [Selenomonadaceae bacterium]